MYQLAMPAAQLQPYIESYWCVRASADAPLDLSVEVFVDVRADLVFMFGVAYERSEVGGGRQIIAHSNLDAQRLYPMRIVQRGEVVITGVRFHAGALAPFVSGSVHQWNDRVVPIVEVFGEGVRELERALREAGEHVDAHKQLLDAFLAARMRVSENHAVFRSVMADIESAHGDARMDALCERAGVSQRQLDRLFRANLGFSPKTYSRVVRFQHALNLLKTDPRCTLADIAARCGYYDQPHFVREFKAYAGSVPKARVGYFPSDAPTDFSPNLVQFVQDEPDS